MDVAEARSAERAAVRVEDPVFRLLALCAQRPGHPQIAVRLAPALAAIPTDVDLAACSEQHGLAPLLLAHIRAAKASVPSSLSVRLFARAKHHASAAAVRRRILGEAVAALTDAKIPLLVLKGAALAHLVYGDIAWRPMRDVDLLVPRQDARRAHATLRQIGFVPSDQETPAAHHHLPGLFKTDAGTTVVIELHHELLPPTPFIAPTRYDDFLGASQAFEWDGLTLHALGREDMLWHVYAHAFVINPLCPGIRLISLADLIHATEAWADALDWDRLRRRYARMVRALRLVHPLAPWSTAVAEALRVEAAPTVSDVRGVAPSIHWRALASRDVLWPTEWWFRMRYGVDGPGQWLWYRSAGHPLRVGLAAARTAARRVSRRLGVTRPHPLLDPQPPRR